MSFLKIGNRKSYSNITVYYLLGTTRKKYNYEGEVARRTREKQKCKRDLLLGRLLPKNNKQKQKNKKQKTKNTHKNKVKKKTPLYVLMYEDEGRIQNYTTEYQLYRYPR